MTDINYILGSDNWVADAIGSHVSKLGDLEGFQNHVILPSYTFFRYVRIFHLFNGDTEKLLNLLSKVWKEE